MGGGCLSLAERVVVVLGKCRKGLFPVSQIHQSVSDVPAAMTAIKSRRRAGKFPLKWRPGPDGRRRADRLFDLRPADPLRHRKSSAHS
jgi:hypothetical protein